MNKDEAKWAKQNREFIQTYASEFAEAFYNEVRKLTPVKSGRLRDGWTLSKQESGSTSRSVSNDVSYLNYVDQGTRYIKPRRFIEAAFQRTMNNDEVGRKTEELPDK